MDIGHFVFGFWARLLCACCLLGMHRALGVCLLLGRALVSRFWCLLEDSPLVLPVEMQRELKVPFEVLCPLAAPLDGQCPLRVLG